MELRRVVGLFRTRHRYWCGSRSHLFSESFAAALRRSNSRAHGLGANRTTLGGWSHAATAIPLISKVSAGAREVIFPLGPPCFTSRDGLWSQLRVDDAVSRAWKPIELSPSRRLRLRFKARLILQDLLAVDQEGARILEEPLLVGADLDADGRVVGGAQSLDGVERQDRAAMPSAGMVRVSTSRPMVSRRRSGSCRACGT